VGDEGPAGADPAGDAAAPPGARRRLLALLAALTVVVAVADQVSKYLAESRLREGEVVPVLGDLLGLQLVHNPGAAFSFATGMTWVFTVVSLVVVAVIVRTSRRLGSRGWATALGLLLGGSLGNLADRLFREPGFGTGHVVDFINYNGWFVGNVADIAIVGAAVLVAVLALLGREVDGGRAPDGRRDGEPGA
jgi:signal peptidase II